MSELLDLSMPLSSQTVPVPGHPQPTFAPLHPLERDGVRNTVISLSLHTGTHIDAPSHFIADGATIDEIAIDRFHGPDARLDLTAHPRARPSAWPARRGRVRSVRVAGIDCDARDGVDRSLETPREAVRRQPLPRGRRRRGDRRGAPSAIGLDFAVDDRQPFPNHTVLFGADVLLIENLMGLPGLPVDGFTVIAFPIRIERENGGPARVVAESPV